MRVLKPGGHLLAFGGTRTWHRLAAAVEDAGFEIRDSIAWLYGSGFPKSLDVSKAIDKAAGAERALVGRYAPPSGQAWNLSADESTPGAGGTMGKFGKRSDSLNVTAPSTDEARQWAGWGTALKPAFEPIVVGRKPLTGTVAANVLTHGTGALNIDACRTPGITNQHAAPRGRGYHGGAGDAGSVPIVQSDAGRWPANVILDDTQAAELDKQTGVLTSGAWDGQRNASKFGNGGVYNDMQGNAEPGKAGDSGGASRFFPTFRYEAKAPTSERPRGDDGEAHPTVKPLDLMRWLVRLVTPPGGLVLEPFLGSGTTAEACIVEGFRCIGIERDETYMRLAVARLSKPIEPVLDFGGAA
jgi:hypothetical protein